MANGYRGIGSAFEFGTWYTGLPNNREKCPDPKFIVVRDRNRHRTSNGGALHDDVAPALTYALKTVLFEQRANLAS